MPADGHEDSHTPPTEGVGSGKKRRALGIRGVLGIVAFLVLLSGVAVGGYYFFKMYTNYLRSGVETTPRAYVPVIEGNSSSRPSPVSGDYTVLNLYYPVEGKLVTEERSVPRVVSVRAIATSVVKEFLAGTSGRMSREIPSEAKLLGAYYGEDGVLYLDLSNSFKRNFQGGAHEEYLLLKALHESLMANVYKVSGVKLLVEGKEVDSIGGHLCARGMLSDAVASGPAEDHGR